MTTTREGTESTVIEPHLQVVGGGAFELPGHQKRHRAAVEAANRLVARANEADEADVAPVVGPCTGPGVYVPTDAQVRARWVFGGPDHRSGEDFDRWVAARDAQVEARVLADVAGDASLRLSGHSGISVKGLLARARKAAARA